MANMNIDIWDDIDVKTPTNMELYDIEEGIKDIRFRSRNYANSEKVKNGLKEHHTRIIERCNKVIIKIEKEFYERDFCKAFSLQIHS